MPFSWLIPIAASAVGSLISGSSAKSAAKTQSSAANHAADVQLQMFNQTRQDLAPFIGEGSLALGGPNGLNALLGLGGGDAGGGTPGTPGSAGQPDWAKLLQDRPDVMAAYNLAINGGVDPNTGQRIDAADRNSPVFLQKGLDSPEHYAQYWYDQMGGQNSYKVGMTGATPGAAGAGGANGMLDALRNTPGYKFTLGEGLNGVLAKGTATGGVGGGNTLKALLGYGEGLADTTYQQRVGDLYNLAGLGENAAAGLGAQSGATAGRIGDFLTQGANASAAGTAGIAGAAGSFINSPAFANFLANLTNGGGGVPGFLGSNGLDGSETAIGV